MSRTKENILLSVIFVEQVECNFYLSMRSKGIYPYDARVDIIEKKGCFFWLIHIFFFHKGQDYCYTFRRKPTMELITPIYMLSIVEKIIKKFQIQENKDGAAFMLKRDLLSIM